MTCRSCGEQTNCAGSPEHFRMDGRLQDEDDDQERKKQKAAQREQRHLEHLPAVGAETGNRNTFKSTST